MLLVDSCEWTGNVQVCSGGGGTLLPLLSLRAAAAISSDATATTPKARRHPRSRNSVICQVTQVQIRALLIFTRDDVVLYRLIGTRKIFLTLTKVTETKRGGMRV